MRITSMALLAPGALLATAVLGTGCTWVHMAPEARAVKVVDGPPAGCTRRGEVAVSVKDSIAFYEAPGLGADTIQPLGPPIEGEQRFAAWNCTR